MFRKCSFEICHTVVNIFGQEATHEWTCLLKLDFHVSTETGRGESASNTTSATTDATIHSRAKCSFTDFTENIQLKLKQWMEIENTEPSMTII